MKIKSLKNFKLIRIAYSEQYLSKKYPSISEYHSLILSFINEFKKLDKKESKVKTKRFFDSLEKMSDISENSLGDLYSKVINTEFESKERIFHPKLVENLNDKESREWVQNLLDSKVELEEDIPKIVQNIKDFDSLSSDKSLKDFSSDSELFKYLSQFKQESDGDYPDELKALLKEWKLGEDEVDGHKIELFYVRRIPMGKKDSLQILGESTNWCVCAYPNPEMSYKPDEYHCFFIDGEPKVLAHLESGQIKDDHDSPLNNHLIKYIDPLAQRFGITGKNAEQYEYDEGDGDDYFESDFDDYDQALVRIKSLEENKDNSEYMRGKISQDVTTLNYLPANDTWKYMDILYQKIDGPITRAVRCFSLSHEVLDNLGNYIQVNKLETPNNLKMEVLEILEYRSGAYLKDVPSSIRKLFPEFNEGFEVLRNQDPEKTIQESDLYKTELYCEFLKKSPINWWPRWPEYAKLDLFPEVYDSLVDGFYKVINMQPLLWGKLPKEISSDEKILELRPKVIERYQNRFKQGKRKPSFWASIPKDLRSDPEFSVYEDKVIEDCKNLRWDSIPEELKSHPELASLKEEVKKEILEKATNDLNFIFPPDLLVDDDDFREKIIHLCVRKLKTKPYFFVEIPHDLRSDDRVIDARREGFLYKLQVSPEIFSDLPKNLQQDKDMIEAQRMGYINKVRNNYSKYKDIPEELAKDKDILAARRWLDLQQRIQNRSVWTWNIVPDELKSDPDFEALKPGVIDQMCKDLASIPGLLDTHPIPKDLLGDEKLYEAVLSAVIKLIHINPKNAYLVPSRMLEDERYITEIIKVFTKELEERPFSGIPYEYAHIRELQFAKIDSMKRAVERDPLAIVQVPQNLLKEPVIQEAVIIGSVSLLKEDLINWAKIDNNIKKDPRIQNFKNAVVDRYVGLLGTFEKAWIPEDLKDDPRIQPLIANRTASKGFKMIRVAYSEQYLSKQYPSLSKYHPLILSFINEFKKLPKKESKVKTKKFFDSLEKMEQISENSLGDLYTSISSLSFKNKDVRKFHPAIIENLDKLEEREWVQNLLDNKIELEEDIPKMVQHLKEFNRLGGEKALSGFKNDSELFQYLSQFKQTVEADYPDKLKELLKTWKVGEDEVDGHKVELYYLERVKIDHRDSLQIIGEDTNWCVCAYPSPVTLYEPDEFHCFFIDNEPKVLVHLDGGQIKGVNDEVLDNHLIKYINPLVEKYNITPENDRAYDEDGFDDVENDFLHYDESLKKIRDLESKLEDKPYIQKQILDDVGTLNYLPLDETWKYMDVLYSKLEDKNCPILAVISFDVYNNLGNYIKTNNLECHSRLKRNVLQVIANQTNQYFKLIPPSIRKFFPEFNEGFEILRDKNSKNTKGDDKFYKTELYFELLKEDPRRWFRDFPQSEDLKDHPRVFETLVEGYLLSYKTKKMHFDWNTLPKEIRSDPRFDEIRKELINHHVALFKPHNMKSSWHTIPMDLRSDPAFLPFRDQVIELCKNDSWDSIPEDLRDSPELVKYKEISKGRHLEFLRKELLFTDVPKDFFDDEVFKQSVIDIAISHLEVHPKKYDKLPRFLRNDDILRATRKGYLGLLRRNPIEYCNMPEGLESDPGILGALRAGWIESLRNNRSNEIIIPGHLRSDPEIIKAQLEGKVLQLKTNGWNWGHFKDELKAKPEIQACIPYVIADIIKSLEESPDLLRHNALPVDLLSSVELYNAIKVSYSRLLKDNPHNWYLVHKLFENDEDLLKDYENSFIRLLSWDPSATIPKELEHLQSVQDSKKKSMEDSNRQSSSKFKLIKV